MAKNRVWLALGALLVVLGIASFLLQPGEPDAECAPEGAPSSGFVDDESGCPITIESYEEIRAYETSPKPFRIAGLVLVLAGLGCAIAGLVMTMRGRGSARGAPPA